MNRFKKEEARAHQKAREGLTDAEIKLVDEQDALNKKISEIARTIHLEWFPEEYDHQLDSIADAADRRSGINPMNADYTKEVNERRKKLGVQPLGSNGMPTSNESWDIAYSEARKQIT
ncbi:hypothetical protein [Marinobacter sp. DY40_1A1]|uniref:hypothetical protein n=1 Tax=Marinobacter sp. DY40_1A1 TaxID=2583229 RepID=UPI001907B11A|nr:hypothetical protein [Marinobacter sp. DY40_1A1]MBK1887766.1 hypothetical protein [Marinobacter sp. DY40_1A1]